MIIVSNKDTTNYVFFPRNIYEDNTDTYNIVLIDRGSNKEYSYLTIIDEHLANIGYYTFALNFKNLPKGEYEYKIFDSNDKVVSKGLIRLNELKQDNIYYDTSRRVNVSYNKNNEYITYDA